VLGKNFCCNNVGFFPENHQKQCLYLNKSVLLKNNLHFLHIGASSDDHWSKPLKENKELSSFTLERYPCISKNFCGFDSFLFALVAEIYEKMYKMKLLSDFWLAIRKLTFYPIACILHQQKFF